MASSAWKIRVGVELDTSDLQSQLDKATPKVKIDGDSTGAVDAAEKAKQSVKDVGLEYQQYKIILDKCIDTIKSMAEQTMKLDVAQTELKKVSDLSGKSLDDYTKKLAKMGQQVGRSG